MTISDFVKNFGIHAEVKRGADERAHARMGLDMTPWTVTLRRGSKSMTVPYFTGKAITREPDAESVLECLVLEAVGYDNASHFEMWAGDYGYNTDSVSAKNTYVQIRKQTQNLRNFLGDLYDTAWACEAV